MALVPTIIRAYSITWNICAMPSCTSPSSQPVAGTPCWPKVTSVVADALRPILCSTLVTKAPLRSPGSPVLVSNRNLGTRNRLRPLVPGLVSMPGPSGRASTRCMMFSVMSWSPEVMNRFTPSMCQEPSGCGVALVRPAPTSEPASGSVRTIVAPQPRSIISLAQCFCSSVPFWSTTAAKFGPAMYMKTAGFEPRISSAAAQVTDAGMPKPPSSAGRPMRYHSPSHSAW